MINPIIFDKILIELIPADLIPIILRYRINIDKLLIKASSNGHLEIVKYLHENGADITAQNNYAIKYANLNGHLEIVKYLYKYGARHN